MKSVDNYSEIKKSGVTFTSSPLALYLATRIAAYIKLSQTPFIINDPACGDGELLLAISHILKESNYQFSICGTDKFDEYISVVKKKVL